MNDIGWAREQLHKGERVRRMAWKSVLWIAVEPSTDVRAKHFTSRTIQSFCESNGGKVRLMATCVAASGNGVLWIGWEASTADLLATDWEIAA